VGTGKPGSRPPASILLVSDGGSNAGRIMPSAAAAAARKAGITVSTIAVGTPAGQVSQKVPLGTNSTKTFPVVRQVPVDPSALQAVAKAGGGTFASAGTATQLNQVYKNLGKRLIYAKQLREVTEIVAGAGLLVMLVGVGLSAFWFRRLV
jgi:Ca-activated chloride channel family protein